MDPIVLWQHKWSADLFIPSYLFLGGLAGGLFVVAALADLASLGWRRLEGCSRVAALVAVPVLALAGFFLTFHLGKPERGFGFPLFFTNYQSWMTRGGWVVGAGAPLLVLYAALWYFRAFPGLRRLLAVLGLPLLAALAGYTGFLLSGAGFVPLWSRQHLPALFLTSGLTGAVALAGLGWLAAAALPRRVPEDPRPVLRVAGIVLALLILTEAWELAGLMDYLRAGAPDKAAALAAAGEDRIAPRGEFLAATGSRLAWEYLTGGSGYPWKLLGAAEALAVEEAVRPRPTLAPWFWWGVVGFGFLLPLALTLLEFASDLFARGMANLVAAPKFLSVLVGGYLLRLVLVWGGDLKAPLPYPPAVWPVPPVLPPGLGG